MAGGITPVEGPRPPRRDAALADPGAARALLAPRCSLPEVGLEGQLKLLDAKVLLLGAGGLGSPTALYLAAAGVGTIGLVDDDVVDASNLQRQVIHNTERIGMPKTESREDRDRGAQPRRQGRRAQRAASTPTTSSSSSRTTT